MRIGVFVCHCGSNIGGTVDCAQVAKNALGFADVVYATDLMYTCAEPGQAAIEKAIQTSDIGLNPQNDGSSLRLNFPPLTEERRKELVKGVYKYAEEAKVSVRSVRRDAMEKLKDMKKKAEITEDDLKNAEKKMQDLTDKFCKEIDVTASKKDKEIMEI